MEAAAAYPAHPNCSRVSAACSAGCTSSTCTIPVALSGSPHAWQAAQPALPWVPKHPMQRKLDAGAARALKQPMRTHLKDEQARVLHKLLFARCQEKVIVNHVLALLQLLLGTVKVIVHKQGFQKQCDWVAVLIGLLLDGPVGAVCRQATNVGSGSRCMHAANHAANRCADGVVVAVRQSVRPQRDTEARACTPHRDPGSSCSNLG